jgi:AcrR family transcriptional regulator
MCAAISPDDRTAAARIRDAAIVRFGDVGFQRATVRDIAVAAGVSPGLILHHYGSKAGLRSACDDYVIAEFARSRNEAVDSGTTDPFAAMADMQREVPMTRYFLQSLREGSPAAARLFDGLVEQSAQLMERSAREGVLRPSDNLRDQASVLVAWLFGGMLLQEHVARAFGAKTFDQEAIPRYAATVLEILTHGVFADTRYEDAWRAVATSGEPPPSAGGGSS